MTKKLTKDKKEVDRTLDLLKEINPEQATQDHAQETFEELDSLFQSAGKILKKKKKLLASEKRKK